MQGLDVGAIVDSVGRYAVPGPVTGQESNLVALPLPKQDIGRGFSVRRVPRRGFPEIEIFPQRIQAAATDDG